MNNILGGRHRQAQSQDFQMSLALWEVLVATGIQTSAYINGGDKIIYLGPLIQVWSINNVDLMYTRVPYVVNTRLS